MKWFEIFPLGSGRFDSTMLKRFAVSFLTCILIFSACKKMAIEDDKEIQLNSSIKKGDQNKTFDLHDYGIEQGPIEHYSCGMGSFVRTRNKDTVLVPIDPSYNSPNYREQQFDNDIIVDLGTNSGDVVIDYDFLHSGMGEAAVQVLYGGNVVFEQIFPAGAISPYPSFDVGTLTYSHVYNSAYGSEVTVRIRCTWDGGNDGWANLKVGCLQTYDVYAIRYYKVVALTLGTYFDDYCVVFMDNNNGFGNYIDADNIDLDVNYYVKNITYDLDEVGDPVNFDTIRTTHTKHCHGTGDSKYFSIYGTVIQGFVLEANMETYNDKQIYVNDFFLTAGSYNVDNAGGTIDVP